MKFESHSGPSDVAPKDQEQTTSQLQELAGAVVDVHYPELKREISRRDQHLVLVEQTSARC